jgi:hypothetical protein
MYLAEKQKSLALKQDKTNYLSRFYSLYEKFFYFRSVNSK